MGLSTKYTEIVNSTDTMTSMTVLCGHVVEEGKVVRLSEIVLDVLS